uniref:Uncharacterized protein n=1 Tax=Leersia perrieri TaxID=77586 RepID=A0A0D9WDP0_9ORYZ
MTEMEDIISDVEIEELGNSMKDELRNYLSSNIVHADCSEFCLIPRIHEYIRAIDRDSYEPIALSIGPYHNGSPEFSSLEREKWNCLDYILKLNWGFNEFLMPQAHRCMDYSSHARTLEGDLGLRHQSVTGTNEIQQINAGTHNAMKGNSLEHGNVNRSHSREGYSVPEIELSSETSEDQKAQYKYQENTQRIGKWYNIFVSCDLFLIENQIPFFIIQGIYKEVVSHLPNKMAATDACANSIVQSIEQLVQYYPVAIQELNRPKDFDHLLHLCHIYFRPGLNQDERHGHTSHYIHNFLQLGQDYLNLVYKQEAANFSSSQNGHFPYQWRRATQYHEAGIKFRRRVYLKCNPHSLLDIKLRDSVLEIPFLFVDETTSFLFRNFIALEQTSPKIGNDVTTYVLFMAKLMSMPDDVALLSRNGIVAHHLRTDRELSQLFTKLMKGVVFDMYGNYYLKPLCLALEAHYQNRLHKWIAWLRHNHFSNPWVAVAGLAGAIVLFCTVAQTVLTVFSYINPSSWKRSSSSPAGHTKESFLIKHERIDSTLSSSSSGRKDSFSEAKGVAIIRPIFHPPYIAPCAGIASVRTRMNMKGERLC